MPLPHKNHNHTTPPKDFPVWKGPEHGGVTSSLINRFLSCRERFRIYAIEGLAVDEGFNHRIEYGSMWHVAEEVFAAANHAPDFCRYETWRARPREYAAELCRRFPHQQEQVDHWYRVLCAQFPAYVAFWSGKKDPEYRKPLLQEYSFDVQYQLPSKRWVRLRGKWDSVDLTGSGKAARVVLMENKTKGDINEVALKRQLAFDCQTMTYLTALHEYKDNAFWQRANKAWRNLPANEVRYNVVRRPLSGGRHSIVRHKAKGEKPEETKEHYYERLAGLIAEEPEYFFMRWNVTVTDEDVRTFRRQFLDPILEQLCDWWEWVGGCYVRGCNVWDNDVVFNGEPWGDDKPHASAIHWRHPFGLYNVLDEGGSDELDTYLATGSTAGLRKVTTVFPELEGG